MKVLFFDLATSTGYAAGSLRGIEAWGTFELPRTFENIGKFLNIADRRIEKLVERFSPSMIGFESPFINRRIDTIVKVRKLAGLANVVEQVADRHEIDCVEASTDEICRHFVGRDYPRNHDAKKIAVKVKCRDLGFSIANDDEADAIAGVHYVLSLDNPGKALELVPLFAKQEEVAI